MKTLVLGGTVFVGRHIVEAALAAGHEVSVFNRGSHDVSFSRDVEKIKGDRATQVDLLKVGKWDSVIDTCGYLPGEVKLSAEQLSAVVERYIFISTISVYSDFKKMGMTENAPLAKIGDAPLDKKTNETYGALKALCEAEVQKAYPGRCLILRPGLIVGPFDPTERFTYWIRRIKCGGAILAPGSPEGVIQIIDVRDLAKFCISLVNRRSTGVYNVTGPENELTFEGFLKSAITTSGTSATLNWVDDDKLVESGINPGNKLPLWLPASLRSYKGFTAINSSKAFTDGLKIRSLNETIRGVADWIEDAPEPLLPGIGLSEEEEQAIIGPSTAS